MVKALLLGLFLGGLGAGLTWFLYPKPKYRATAAIQVQFKTPTVLPGSVPAGGDEPIDVYIRSEMERFRFGGVLKAAEDLIARAEAEAEANDAARRGDTAVGEQAGQRSDAVPSKADESPLAGATTLQAKTPGDGDSLAAVPGDGSSSTHSPEAASGTNPERQSKFAKIFGDGDRREWLREHLEVTSNGTMIRVALQSEERDGLDEIVNMVVEAYLSDNEDQLAKYAKAKSDLDNLSKEYEASLEVYRKKLQELTEKGQDPNDPRTFALTRQLGLERYAQVQHDYSKLKGDLKRVEAQLAGLHARFKPRPLADISEADIDKHFRSLDPVRQLDGEIADLDERIEQVRYTSRKENDAAIVKFQQQRRLLMANREKLFREWRPEIIQRLQDQQAGNIGDGSTTANQIAALEMEVKLLTEFKAEMEAELRMLAKQNEEYSKSAADMFRVENDFKYANQAAERIRTRLAELEVERDAPPRVKLVDPAVPPVDRTDQKKKMMSTAMMGGGLFAASLAMVAFLEFRTRRVKAPDEVVRGLGMSVVGTIPSLPDPKTRRPGNVAKLADSRWQQAFMESVDATRMLLLHMSRSENLRAVMITSANSGEGKTSLSSYLGGSLARAVHRTLIVDCDLRRPAVHQVFDTPLEPGLSDLLRGEAEIQDIVRPTPIEGLFVISAGRADSRAMLSLNKGELGPILDWLKEQYDFVIVDAPPVLAVADTLQLSQHVDAVLFSILRDVSRMPAVYEARERLATMNIRVLGAVVSGTPLMGIGYDRRYAYYGEKVST